MNGDKGDLNRRQTKTKDLITRLLFITAALACAVACNEPSDQTIILPAHLKIGNPAPTQREFAKINQNHKVLMAIFDSGIDYNHPDLINNVHFDLDAQGRPIAAGKDYLANDNWASWHIVATNMYQFKNISKEMKEDVLRESTADKYDVDLQRRIGLRMCIVKELVSIDPRLSKYIHEYRATDVEEDPSIRHGTHVAGLMTYDRPDFGLIPYRLLPYHQSRQDKIDFNVGRADKFAKNFADAVDDAEKRGVRIINMSLGGSFERPDTNSTVQDEANLERFNNFYRIITQSLTATVRAHPRILFVAAAGNDKGWSDNKSRIQYPCGVEADNMLCVGALNNRDDMTTFTNIPLRSHLVFAPGSALNSLSPSDRCPFINKLMDDFLLDSSGAALCTYNIANKKWSVDPPVARVKAELVKAGYDACSMKANLYTKMSGTSMATPLVAHFAAELLAQKDYPLAADLIKDIRSRGVPFETENFRTRFLTWKTLKKPHWEFEPVPKENLMLSSKQQKGLAPANYSGYTGFYGGHKEQEATPATF